MIDRRIAWPNGWSTRIRTGFMYDDYTRNQQRTLVQTWDREGMLFREQICVIGPRGYVAVVVYGRMPSLLVRTLIPRVI